MSSVQNPWWLMMSSGIILPFIYWGFQELEESEPTRIQWNKSWGFCGHCSDFSSSVAVFPRSCGMYVSTVVNLSCHPWRFKDKALGWHLRWNGDVFLSFLSETRVFFWLVVWLPCFIFPEILGMSSSQLTFIFFRGVETTNQFPKKTRLTFGSGSVFARCTDKTNPLVARSSFWKGKEDGPRANTSVPIVQPFFFGSTTGKKNRQRKDPHFIVNLFFLLQTPWVFWTFFWKPYLVAHPTNRKWVTTLVINGISGGNVHL